MCGFWKQIVTEPNNETFCPVRIVSLIGVLEYLGITLHNYIKHAQFDSQGFAIGFGALIAGTGVALGLKKDAPKEP
jgi:spore maturation protein SpmB